MTISKLYSECKDYVWGGNKLKTDYNKADLPNNQER